MAVRFTLTKKISLLLLIPLFGSLISIAFFVGFLEETKTDSHFINVAGRQRMLSAEFRAWAHMVAIGQEEDRAGLRERIVEFEKSLSAMERGGEVLDGTLAPAPPEVRGELAAVENFWRALKPDLTDVAVKPRGETEFQKAYRRVESGTVELRDLSSQLVTRFEERTRHLRRRMFYTLVSAACLTGIAFLAGVFLTRRYIVQPILRVDEAARRITDGDFSQRLAITTRDELSVLAYTFNQMVSQTEHLLRALNLRRRHAEIIVASVPAGLLVLRGDLAVLRANRSFRETFGVDEQAIARRPMVTELLPVNGLEEAALEVLSTGEAKRNLTMEMTAKDHPPRLLRIALTGTRLAEEEEEEEEEEEARLLVVVEDVTEEQRLRSEVRAHERRFHDLVQGLDAVVWEAETAGEEIRFTFVSDRAETLLGYPVQRWLEHEFWPAVVHPDDRDKVFGFYNRMLERGGRSRERFEVEYRALKASGDVIWLHDVVHPTLGAEGAERLRGVTVDVSARKHAEERLSHLAFYDTLTELPNRVLLLERLQQAMVDAERVNRLVAVMFLDLDRFKVINDTLGHHVGDALLKAVAERLKSCLRPGDIIARLGGDEFTVVLANVAHVDDVARVARKILDSFAEPFRVDGRELFTTTSIGITLYPFDEQNPERLLKNADAAMYLAKERGRNDFQFFTAELNVRAERRLRLETALRQALGENQLSLHYQPQVDLKSGRIVGMEALARWQHPELGAVSPAEFIPIAEETGLILPIGDWALREACRQIKAWHATGFPKLQVAVNLSGKQLRQKGFADRVRDILLETKLEPRYLDLELTESLLMVDADETGDIMHVLHDLGVSFSVDDFGTGYSSLAYLKRFPIDILKIDQSFVRDLATDPNDAAIVKTVIAMAHTLGMRVIAEGVETYEQLEFLRDQNCDGTQGYYCSKPLTAEDFTELLADWKRLSLGKCRLEKPRRRPVRARTTRGPARPRKEAG